MLCNHGGTVHTLMYVNDTSRELVWFLTCAPVHDGLRQMYTIFISEMNGVQDSCCQKDCMDTLFA